MHDVIVVGAGLSGLVCARRLVEGGASVLVLEARERVGGRLLTGSVGGTTVDLGGQWVTAGQDRLVALARELGVATVNHARDGRAVVDESVGFFASLRAAIAQRRATATIDALMRAVPPGEPAHARDAALLDGTTLGAFLDTTVANEVARERIRLHADLVFAQEAADLSLLAYLATMRATGGFAPEGELPGGGREHRFVGGAQSLATKLAERVGAGNMRFGARVTAIVQDSERVVVRGANDEHAAKRVVLAVPPVLLRAVSVELPPAQRAYVDGVRAGAVVKCFAAYETAFWRERGLSGEAYLPRGAVRAVVEIAGDPPALLAFVVGAQAASWAARDPDERRAQVLETLAGQLGEAALQPIDYVEHDWAADPLSAGCVAATPPHVLAGGARWREPFGRVHVAGTEAAIAWPGYMEGAIEAGERAAAEVLAAQR